MISDRVLTLRSQLASLRTEQQEIAQAIEHALAEFSDESKASLDSLLRRSHQNHIMIVKFASDLRSLTSWVRA